MKLFRATTEVSNYKGFNRLHFVWFVESRAKPLPLPYEDLIDGYWSLGRNERGYAEEALQERFTEQEIDQLREYLLLFRSSSPLMVSELELPSKTKDYPPYPWGAMTVGGLTDFYMLSDHEDYRLPFSVWGYFDLRDAIPTFIDESGLQYAKAILQEIGIESTGDIKTAIRDIFDQASLFAYRVDEWSEMVRYHALMEREGAVNVSVTQDGVRVERAEEQADREALKARIGQSDTIEELLGDRLPSRNSDLMDIGGSLTYAELLLQKLGLHCSSERLRKTVEMIYKRDGFSAINQHKIEFFKTLRATA